MTSRRTTFYWLSLSLLPIIGLPLLWFAALNLIGPSTEYHRPSMPTAKPGPDGRWYIYVGDKFHVNITVVRHALNGNCRFVIRRYFEAVGGPQHGQRYLVSADELQFPGANQLLDTRWPQYYDIVIGYAVNENNQTQLDQPLLPVGIDEQEFLIYVVGRYYCNVLDYLVPRYIQGRDRPNETDHLRVVVRRHKP